jgi:hypothetical protein
MEPLMQITLYQAAAQVRDMLEQIDVETGELPEGFEHARELVAAKAQACAAFILENDAQANMVEAHAKALLDRVRTARKRSDWLREYLRSHMAASGVLSLKSDDGTFSAVLSPGRDESVEVFDAAQLPPDYLREVPAKYEPDKALIKKAMKDGFEVPGARLVAKDRLTLK